MWLEFRRVLFRFQNPLRRVSSHSFAIHCTGHGTIPPAAELLFGGRSAMRWLMRSKLLLPVIAVSLLALSACGTSPGCRALTGAGIGAAGGAVLGAIGGNPLLGAGAGAVAGGAVGGLTTSHQVNAGPAPCH